MFLVYANHNKLIFIPIIYLNNVSDLFKVKPNLTYPLSPLINTKHAASADSFVDTCMQELAVE